MVERQLAGRGISDVRVLDAFRAVPRESFVPAELAEFAYRDAPLPIGEDQTISQPYIVALTIEALGLEGGERVLEIGTGSGYAAAVLSRIAQTVFTVERRATLAAKARERLESLGYANVQVLRGDGTLGWPEPPPHGAKGSRGKTRCRNTSPANANRAGSSSRAASQAIAAADVM